MLYIVTLITVCCFSLTGFEKAYCEYRLNRNSDALKTLTAIENRNAAANELLAQVVGIIMDCEQ